MRRMSKMLRNSMDALVLALARLVGGGMALASALGPRRVRRGCRCWSSRRPGRARPSTRCAAPAGHRRGQWWRPSACSRWSTARCRSTGCWRSAPGPSAMQGASRRVAEKTHHLSPACPYPRDERADATDRPRRHASASARGQRPLPRPHHHAGDLRRGGADGHGAALAAAESKAANRWPTSPTTPRRRSRGPRPGPANRRRWWRSSTGACTSWRSAISAAPSPSRCKRPARACAAISTSRSRSCRKPLGVPRSRPVPSRTRGTRRPPAIFPTTASGRIIELLDDMSAFRLVPRQATAPETEKGCV